MYNLLVDLTIPMGDYGSKTFFQGKVIASYRTITDDPFNKYRLVQLVLIEKATGRVVEVLGEKEFTKDGKIVITNQAEIDAAVKQINDLEASKTDLDPASPTYNDDIAAIQAQIDAVVRPEPVTKRLDTYDEIVGAFNPDSTLTDAGKVWVTDNVVLGGVSIADIVDLNS